MLSLNRVLAVVALVSVVVAQSGNSTINPASVDLTTRNSWCSGQISTCGILCSSTTATNTCDSDKLTFDCTCKQNNSQPGLQYYTQTLPTFICEEVHAQCIAAYAGAAAQQKQCDDSEVQNCGHNDPAKFTASPSSSSSSSASATASSSESASATATKKGSADTLNIGRNFGLGMVAATIFTCFL